jgi:subtilisin
MGLFRAMALVAIAVLLCLPLGAAAADEQIVPRNIQRIGADVAELPFDREAGTDIDVAIIDGGIDDQHADLNVVDGVNCSPPNAGKMKGFTPPEGDSPYRDYEGHGTMVAGIIGAEDNGFGVVGVAPGARLYAVKIFNEEGETSDKAITCALQWVLAHGDTIDVVNMSMGALVTDPDAFKLVDTADGKVPAVDDQPMGRLITQVLARGIPVVAAAGNDPFELRNHRPAGQKGVISVSWFTDTDGQPGGVGSPPVVDSPCWMDANDDQFFRNVIHRPDGPDTVVDSSSYGEGITIAAPGTCVLSTAPGGGLKYGSGTSFAAPEVTGTVALYLVCHPDASVAEVTHWLIDSAEPQPETFHDPDPFHEGILNARKVCIGV